MAPNFSVKEALRRYRKSYGGGADGPIWQQRWAQICGGAVLVLELTGYRVLWGVFQILLNVLKEIVFTLLDVAQQWVMLSDGVALVVYTLLIQLPLVAPLRIALLPVVRALYENFKVVTVIAVSVCVLSLVLEVRLPALERAGFLPLALWRDRLVVRRKIEARLRQLRAAGLRAAKSEAACSGAAAGMFAGLFTLLSYGLLLLGLLLARLGLVGAPALVFRAYWPFIFWPLATLLSVYGVAYTRARDPSAAKFL